MDEDFNVEEFRRTAYRPDTVLTLGPVMLLGIVFGLLLLCGLCFGVGYSMGSSEARKSSTANQQPGAASQAAGSLPKHTASSQDIIQKQQQPHAPKPAP